MNQSLNPIGGGLNESIAPTEQPAGTYREGLNVRGIDSKTGQQVWGAQRAGLSQEGDPLPDGAHARHIVAVDRLVQATRQRSLGLDPLENTDPDRVDYAWSTRLDERVLDVAEGLDGQGYFLCDSGDVAIVNRKGREVDRIYSAVPRGFVAVPRVFVSEDNSVYTAATRDQPVAGVAGYVYRWVKGEDGVYTQVGQSEIATRIATFVQGFGALYVAEDGAADENGDLPEPALTRLPVPFLGDYSWRETVFPRPCFDLTLNPNGQVFASAPSNPDRQAGTGGGVLFTERNVGWTPFELTNFDIGNLWSWVDSQAANDDGDQLQEGEAVIRLRDRRFEENDFAELDEDIPERELTRSPSGIFPPPTWSEEAFGGVGATRFSGTSALVSKPNASLTDIASQQALIPGTLTSWTLVALVEFSSEQALQTAVRQILAQRTNDVAQADWILSAVGTSSSFRDGLASVVSPSLPTSAPARTAIITLQHGGAANPITCRINGTDIIPHTIFPTIEQGGPYAVASTDVELPGPFTVVGAGRPNRANVARASDVSYSTEEADSFAPLERLFNGVRYSSAESDTIILGGSFSQRPIGRKLRLDFDVPRRIDTLVLWSSDTNKSARTARIRTGTDDTFATFDNEWTIDVVPGQGDNMATRTEIAFENPANQLVQCIEIEALTYVTDQERWQLTEVEVFTQDALEAANSAEFNLAEMLVIRGAQLTPTASNPRELIEGYLAHRWGVSHTLDPLHTFFGPGNFPAGLGASSQDQDAAILRAKLNSPFPILAKYGTNGEPLAVYTGAGVGCGAAYADGRVFTIGESQPGDEDAVPDYGATMTRFRDEQRALVRQAEVPDSEFAIDREPIALEAGPCSSIFAATRGGVRRVDGLTMTVEYQLPATTITEPLRAVPGGLQLDETNQGGDCGPEFLFVAQKGLEGAGRINTLGLYDSGEEAGRDVSILVVTSAGDVLRGATDGGWDTVESGALLGSRPGSATLGLRTFFADGKRYRVYDHQLDQLRDFEEAARGQFPPRCQLIAAYRGRLVLARGDNAFTIYQSRFGDPFDFEFGPEVNTISQAIAGTTASQGNSPEAITALMPWRDDLLYIGTTESLYVLTGDLADGGRMDHVDKSQGVAFGYAWCESPRGIYYFSGRGGVMLIGPGGLQLVSGPIQRRLEEIDLRANRVELHYNWVDRCVHVLLIPKRLGSEVRHFCFEEPLQTWHMDSFGVGVGGAVTAAASLFGDTPEDRAVMLGLGDGRVYRWDQYADDDAGRPVESYAIFGPLLGGQQNTEARVSGVYGQLATDQAPLKVGMRGSNSPDSPGPVGNFETLEPGRGLGVPFNVAAPALFVEVRGTGKSWSAHSMRVDINPERMIRPV